MRLRSARLAAAGENEPPSQPTITTRHSRRRAKPRKTEILEADQPASGEHVILEIEPAHQLETGKEGPHDASDGCATAITDLHMPESPVFNAEAAAEAAQMAEALLSSTPSSEQPRFGTANLAARPLQQINCSGTPTEHETQRASSRLSVPEEQAEGFLPGSSPSKSSAAKAAQAHSAASCMPEHAAASDLAAEASPSNRPPSTKTEGSCCPENPAQQPAVREDHIMAETAHIQCHGAMQSAQAAQLLTTAGSEGSQAGHTQGPIQKSPEHRRATGRASLALQSRRASRSGSAEAFERGRKSGIWLGSADVKLGTIEQQWDKYKATSQRGWTLPKLEELHAKSKALESSGFTTVPSPKLRASSRSALTQARPRNQLKRKAEEAAPAGELSKAAKTGTGSHSSPRRKLAIKRSESTTRVAHPEEGQQPAGKTGVLSSGTAAKNASPGRSAGAGSASWAPSPSRFRRNGQENRTPTPALRKVEGGWVR